MRIVAEELKQVLVQALALPEDDRFALIEALSESLSRDDEDLSPEWKSEIESRIAQVGRGEVELIPGEQVDAEIRALLAKRR